MGTSVTFSRRAREFYDVVTGLWDSFADDAFVRDQQSGLYLDPARLHVLNHKGPQLAVRGPLNIAQPPQGWPVIVQAGASEAGRQLAAETAEVVFAAHANLAAGQRLYADVKSRAEQAGRARDQIKILPGAFVIVGDTVEEAVPSAPRSTASFTTKAASLRYPLRSVMMLQASTRTSRCQTFRKPMPAKAGANA